MLHKTKGPSKWRLRIGHWKLGKMAVVRDIDENILVCYWEGRRLKAWWKWIQENRAVRDGRC